MEEVQQKLSALLQSAEYAETLPASSQKSLQKLKELNEAHERLEEDYEEERKALERKYQELYQPIYARRARTVKGDGDASAEIPKFWVVAMTNCEVVNEAVQDKDREVLGYLDDVECVLMDDAMSFKLVFHFSENSFFTNKQLVKTYNLIDDDEPILERATGTEISWKSGKNLTVKTMKKKVPNKKGGKPITKTKQQPCDSFFNFFSPPDLDELEQMDEEQEETMHDLIQADFEIGAAFRERMVPHAVLWFTGEAADDDLELYVQYSHAPTHFHSPHSSGSESAAWCTATRRKRTTMKRRRTIEGDQLIY
jgi:nucleosome assembly protein 1-like 1